MHIYTLDFAMELKGEKKKNDVNDCWKWRDSAKINSKENLTILQMYSYKRTPELYGESWYMIQAVGVHVQDTWLV